MQLLLLILVFLKCAPSSSSPRSNLIRDKLMSPGLLGDGGSEGSPGEKLLLASTLDGGLHALSSDTGIIKWTMQDDPVVMNPKDSSQPSLARFFPNPLDGSLYRYTLGTPEHPLKKLPFTIPQLVENSPCRSTDGLFYLGKKVDSFVVIERASGEKQLVLGMNSIFESCVRNSAQPSTSTLFIGRTMYNVMLYEQTTGNRWNVTYYDYTTQGTIADENYELVHYAAAGGGSLVTMDKETEALVWSAEFGSPIVALFTLTELGNLMSVPLTVVASQTLQRYLREILTRGSYLLTAHSHSPLQALSPSIYLGESTSGSTYAIPALVDDQIATIQRRLNPKLLLEGPNERRQKQSDAEDTGWRRRLRAPSSRPRNYDSALAAGTSPRKSYYPPYDMRQSTGQEYDGDGVEEDDDGDDWHEDQDNMGLPNSQQDDEDDVFPIVGNSFHMESLFENCRKEPPQDNVVVLGHYKVPDELSENMFPMQSESLPLAITHITAGGQHQLPISTPSSSTSSPDKNSTKQGNIGSVVSERVQPAIPELVSSVVSAPNVVYMHYTWGTESVVLATAGLVILGLIYCIYLLHSNLNATKASAVSNRSGGGGSSQNSAGGTAGEGCEVTAVLEELMDGSMRVGKICFQPNVTLGRGSDGTIVFRGTFEGRPAAVKRVLPNSYRIAAREVQLLRASDHHNNVIRYLCTEQCREFRYIALELCDATLDHYVKGRLSALPPTAVTDRVVMQQATKGLTHLHTLEIVHRDIKPSNVLLQLPRSVSSNSSHSLSPGGDASASDQLCALRVLISDFGLCKKLEAGHGSFTKHSGVTGTDGWIAPEMIRIDLEEHRPTRAVDVFSLGCVYYYVATGGQHPYGSPIDRQSNIATGRHDLSGTSDVCLRDLLEAMLHHTPLRRPPARALLKHPFFWDSATTLNFLVNASDRVDKFNNDFASLFLEQGAEEVADGWLSMMHPAVNQNLRLHRDYRDNCVKHLLRAIRNKRTHYQELPASVRAVMGAGSTEFLHYWTSRFPRLVHHTWRAMHCCSHEHAFAKYYSSRHTFHPPHLREEDLILLQDDQEEKMSDEAKAVSAATATPRGSIDSGYNYSSERLGSKSFRAYNTRKTQPLAAGLRPDPAMGPGGTYQQFFNKAIDSSNWRAGAGTNGGLKEDRGKDVDAVTPVWILKRRRPQDPSGSPGRGGVTEGGGGGSPRTIASASAEVESLHNSPLSTTNKFTPFTDDTTDDDKHLSDERDIFTQRSRSADVLGCGNAHDAENKGRAPRNDDRSKSYHIGVDEGLNDRVIPNLSRSGSECFITDEPVIAWNTLGSSQAMETNGDTIAPDGEGDIERHVTFSPVATNKDGCDGEMENAGDTVGSLKGSPCADDINRCSEASMKDDIDSLSGEAVVRDSLSDVASANDPTSTAGQTSDAGAEQSSTSNPVGREVGLTNSDDTIHVSSCDGALPSSQPATSSGSISAIHAQDSPPARQAWLALGAATGPMVDKDSTSRVSTDSTNEVEAPVSVVRPAVAWDNNQDAAATDSTNEVEAPVSVVRPAVAWDNNQDAAATKKRRKKKRGNGSTSKKSEG